MKKFAVLFFLAFYSICHLCAQNELKALVTDKTWSFNDDFAGRSITIYQTSSGTYKGLLQIHGSGIPVGSTSLYDINFSGENIYLFNGKELSSKETTFPIKLTYNQEKKNLIYDEMTGQATHDDVQIWTWLDISTNKVDFHKLKEIPLEMNEIYTKQQITNILQK